jgi:hypothetical protein
MTTDDEAITPAQRMLRIGEMTTTFTNQGKACHIDICYYFT